MFVNDNEVISTTTVNGVEYTTHQCPHCQGSGKELGKRVIRVPEGNLLRVQELLWRCRMRRIHWKYRNVGIVVGSILAILIVFALPGQLANSVAVFMTNHPGVTLSGFVFFWILCFSWASRYAKRYYSDCDSELRRLLKTDEKTDEYTCLSLVTNTTHILLPR